MINIVKKYSNNSIEELKKKGIYLIYFKNKLGFYYVGSTKCKDGFYRRWYQHLYKLRKNEHSSPFLQNIYNKYKEDNIVFEIIEEMVDLNNLYLREQYWLDFYNSKYNIINYAPIVAANSLAMTQNTKNKISKSLKGKYIKGNSSNAKKIYKYSVYGEFLTSYNSIIEAGEEINSNNNNFRNTIMPTFHKGFIYSRRKLTNIEIQYFNRFGACKKYWKRIPIAQYDLNHNLIKEWSSCEEASKHYKISSGALNQALKGKVKISKNSIWKYLNYQNPWDLQKS